MALDLEAVKKDALHASLRGKILTFSDGQQWKIPTLPLRLGKDHALNVLIAKAQGMGADEGGAFENEDAVSLCWEAVKLNYPRTKIEEINPDVEDMVQVIQQLTGALLGE